MALHRWFPDWTLVLAGVEEEYKKGGFLIHFSEPRPDRNGSNPTFLFFIQKEDETLYSERIDLDLFQQDRTQIMTNIRQKITQYTGLILSDPKPLQILGGTTSKQLTIAPSKMLTSAPIVNAAAAGRYEVVKYLLELNPRPTFLIACDAITCMLGPGYSVNDGAKGARFHLADQAFLKTVKYLIDKDKETPGDVSSYFALGEAMLGNNYELVKLLLTDNRFHPMKGDLHDNFIYPAHRGYFQTLGLLINDHRTDLSQTIKMGWPMVSNIKMDKYILMSLKDAMTYVINEKRVEGVEYPGFQEFFHQLAIKSSK